MLLKYLGYEITVDEFIQNCLECREMEIRDGVLYGPDPNKFFCGNPYDEEKYYFNDPYDNNGVVGYPRTLVEKRHAAQHSMALGVLKR